MNSLDITIVIIVGISITISTFRGGIREIMSLAGVIAGFVLAAHFYRPASTSFLRLTSHPEINSVISFLAIFFFITVLISFIGGRLSEAAGKSRYKHLNAVLGTAIGALKGVVVCALVVYALLVFLPARSAVFTQSKAFPYLAQAADTISPIAPKFFRDEFKKKLDEARLEKKHD